MARGHSPRVPTSGGPRRPWALASLGLLTALLVAAHVRSVAAQPSPPADQPLAIDGAAALVPSPCKLLVPSSQAVLQPVKIRPEQVPLKNRLGCLSPGDAVYGPDGCPVRLCGPGKGASQLTPLR